MVVAADNMLQLSMHNCMLAGHQAGAGGCIYAADHSIIDIRWAVRSHMNMN
jgi:hypothetical protein